MKRVDLPLLLTLVASAALALGLGGLYYVGSYVDDSLYLSLARSLAQGGGYRDLADPSGAWHDRFPPGYPALLAPFQGLWPESLAAVRVFTLGCSILALGLAWRLARQLAPGRETLVVLLTGLNFTWAHFATTVMSDIPFTLASLAYVLAARHALVRPQRPAGLGGLAVLAGLCTSLRIVGALLVPATALALGVGRRWRELAVYLLACAVVLGPALAGPLLTGYGGQSTLGYSSQARWEGGVWRSNLPYYLQVLPLTLWGDPFRLLPTLASPTPAAAVLLFGLLVTWLALVAGGRHWVREARVLEVAWLGANLALLAVWPYQTPRFLLPLLPWLYAALARVTPGILVAMLAVQSGFAVTGLRQALSFPEAPARELHAWVREHTEADRPVAAEQHSLWLYTGRRLVTLEPGFCRDYEEPWLEQLLRSRVHWLVWQGPRQDFMHRFLARRSVLFRPAAQGEGWSVWEFVPPPELAGQLERFRQAIALQRAGRRAEAQSMLASLPLPGARLELAIMLARAGQREQAAALLKALLAADPENLRAARVLQALGRATPGREEGPPP